MGFGMYPGTSWPVPTPDDFPNFIQFQEDGVDLGGPDADTLNFTGNVSVTRGEGENANVVTVDVPVAGSGGGSDMSAAEFEYWTAKAAMLDPLAYEYVIGTVWSRTVPLGATWYVREAWNTCTGPSGPTDFGRDPRFYDQAPEGTIISGNGEANSHLYVCKPELVTSDPRYADPKGLYYERLAALRYLVRNVLEALVIGGGPDTAYMPFPTDFDYGMILRAQTFEGSWVALSDVNHLTGMNLNIEISDSDRFRPGAGFSDLPLPFTRSVLPDLAVNQGSDMNGRGTVLYVKLPEGF
jgi:hypothetical protein